MEEHDRQSPEENKEKIYSLKCIISVHFQTCRYFYSEILTKLKQLEIVCEIFKTSEKYKPF